MVGEVQVVGLGWWGKGSGVRLGFLFQIIDASTSHKIYSQAHIFEAMVINKHLAHETNGIKTSIERIYRKLSVLKSQ